MGFASLLLSLAACERRPDDVPVVVSVIGGGVATKGAGLRMPSPATAALLAATAEGLVRFDANGAIEPGLAQRWIVRDDNRSFIFRLRDARWPDGERIVADDVVPILRRAVGNRSGGDLAPYLTAIDEIVAMTPQVIEVRLSRPRPDLLKLFASPQLAIPARRGVAGAGPFRIADETPDILLRPVAADDDPDRTAPDPEDYVRLRGERAAAAVLRFAAKHSDLVIGGTLADWPLVELAGIAPANVRIDAASGLFGLAIVARQGFLATPERRVAIALAIDRTGLTAAIRDRWPISEAVLPEQQDAASAPVLPLWTTVAPGERAAAAAAIVSGWGQPVRLRIAMPAGPGMAIFYGQLGAMLRRVGIDTVRVGERDDADLRLVDAIAPYDSVRWYLRTACQPCAAPVADLIAAARDADTLAERGRLLSAADAALARDVAYVPIARPWRWSLVATRLDAFATNSRAIHPLNHLRGAPD